MREAGVRLSRTAARVPDGGLRRVGLADMEGGEAFRRFGLDGYIVDGG